MEPQLAQLADVAEPEATDAFRVQVAAVVAQQAAVTEQEIRLVEREALCRGEREALVIAIEELAERLIDREHALDGREQRLREDEEKRAQLGQTLTWVSSQVERQGDQLGQGRQLVVELGRRLAAAEGHLAQTRKALERVERFLAAEEPAPRTFPRAA